MPMRPIRGMGLCRRWTLRGLTMAVGVAALWAVGMLGHLTFWPGPLRWTLALLWGAAAITALARLDRWRAILTIVLGVVVVAGLAQLQRPRLDRDWSPDQARLPGITWDGHVVHIANLRHNVYRSTTDYDVRWRDDAFDLNQLERVDLVVETLSFFRGMAHTMLSFGFADERYLTLSVEIRKQRGQVYSPLRGLFRQYELMYVLGDERDLIALRANHRGNDVRVYPMAASPEQARTLLRSALDRAAKLGESPEFYHTLHSTCATNLARHLWAINEPTRRWDWRIILPGYSDRLALARGWIADDSVTSLRQLRQRYRINGRSELADPDEPGWSQRIRRWAEVAPNTPQFPAGKHKFLPRALQKAVQLTLHPPTRCSVRSWPPGHCCPSPSVCVS